MRSADRVSEQSAAYLPAGATERKATAPAIITSFTPSIMGEATLRAIFVARQPLIDRIVRDIRDATTTGARRHALLIGPRGIGKTHLISMVYYGVRAEPEVYEKLRIAWLREEDWTVFSWADLLVAIFRALANEYPADRAELLRLSDRLRRLPVAESAAEGEQKLREFLGDRLLLVLAENVNDLFEGMGREGQQSLRAFLQNHSNAVLVTTAPALTDDLSDYDAPFYGFFNTTHLKELTRPEARELLLKIARTNGADEELIEYLQTDEADRRLRVIEALAGGHPRIWILFSACMSKQLLDELVPLFVKMLDDLTPYYQERMRALPPQERRIVAFLCEKRGAVPVKEIADACRLKPNATAALLGKLEEKAYVRKAAEPVVVSVGDRRISYYEMREPLMRLCIEVKENRAEPLSLIVEFLRLWYGEKQISIHLSSLPEDAVITRIYLQAALKRAKSVSNKIRLLLIHANRNMAQEKYDAALVKIHNASNLDSSDIKMRIVLGWLLLSTQDYKSAVDVFDTISNQKPQNGDSYLGKSVGLFFMGDFQESFLTLSTAVSLPLLDANVVKGVLLLWINNAILLSSEQYENKTVPSLLAMVMRGSEYSSSLVEALTHSITTFINIDFIKAKYWLDVWEQVANEFAEIQVPVRMISAAVEWKQTRDRGVLLRLPVEERTVLESLLPKDEATSATDQSNIGAEHTSV